MLPEEPLAAVALESPAAPPEQPSLSSTPPERPSDPFSGPGEIEDPPSPSSSVAAVAPEHFPRFRNFGPLMPRGEPGRDVWEFPEEVWAAIAQTELEGSQWRWAEQGQITLAPGGQLDSSWSADEGRWALEPAEDGLVLLEFSGRQFQMALRKGGRMVCSTRGGPAALVQSLRGDPAQTQLELVFHPIQGRLHCQEWHKWLLGRQYCWSDEAVVVFHDCGRLECPWEANALWLPAPEGCWNEQAGLPEYRVLRGGRWHRLIFSPDRRCATVLGESGSTAHCAHLPTPDAPGQLSPELVLARVRVAGSDPVAAAGYLMKRSGLIVVEWKVRPLEASPDLPAAAVVRAGREWQAVRLLRALLDGTGRGPTASQQHPTGHSDATTVRVPGPPVLFPPGRPADTAGTTDPLYPPCPGAPDGPSLPCSASLCAPEDLGWSDPRSGPPAVD